MYIRVLLKFDYTEKEDRLKRAEELIRGVVEDISDKKSMRFNARNAVERIANRLRDYYKR